MKSLAKKTLVTPSTWNNCRASGLIVVYLIFEKSIVLPSPVTGLPGTNLREDGFGVGYVWMKRLRRVMELSGPRAEGLPWRSKEGAIDR